MYSCNAGNSGHGARKFDSMLFLRDPFVAAAVGAELFAEGQVEVEVDIAIVGQLLVDGGQPAGRVGLPVLPVGHGGVTRIAGHGDVVLSEETHGSEDLAKGPHVSRPRH